MKGEYLKKIMKYRKFSSQLYPMLSTKKLKIIEFYRLNLFCLFVCSFSLIFCFCLALSVFQQNRFKDVYI